MPFLPHNVLVKNPKASLTCDVKPILMLKFSFESKCVRYADGLRNYIPVITLEYCAYIFVMFCSQLPHFKQ